MIIIVLMVRKFILLGVVRLCGARVLIKPVKHYIHQPLEAMPMPMSIPSQQFAHFCSFSPS